MRHSTVSREQSFIQHKCISFPYVFFKLNAEAKAELVEFFGG